jgi:DNA-binding response OmpR family regulator
MSARPPHVLLVDDDVRLVALLEDRLRRDGFEPIVATRGSQAISAIDREWPDLVILDLMLPDMRGDQVAVQIKKRADLPIIVLSAVTEVSSRTASIRDFAEDYLVKPFHYEELRVRVERVLRRMPDRVPAEEQVAATGLTLALRRREAVVNGTKIRLTPVESRFLGVLLAAAGQPLTTEQLLTRVWAGADGADPVYVWVTIRRLRQKLEADPSQPMFIHTVKGGGYRLGDPSGDEEA